MDSTVMLIEGLERRSKGNIDILNRELNNMDIVKTNSNEICATEADGET